MIHPRPCLLTLILAPLAAALLAGCAGPQRATAPRPALPSVFPNHTSDEIIQQLQRHTDALQSYHARGRVSIRTPEREGSFSAEIYHQREGKLYMTISPGLGIEAVRALVSPDSFFVYNRIKNELVYGSRAYAARHLPLALPEDDLFGAMLGLLAPRPERNWQLSADSAYYYLKADDQRYTIDPTVWRVVAYEAHGQREELVEVRTYAAFDRIEGHYLPRQVLLRRPQDETMLQLYYGSLELAPEDMQFELDISPSATRVLVDPASP